MDRSAAIRSTAYRQRCHPAALLALTLGVAGIAFPLRSSADIAVHTNFEGGSARVVSIDQPTATIRLMPGGDSKRGWPCWWAARIEGLTMGREVTFELLASDQPQHQPGPNQGKPLSASWSRPERPAISTNGTDWTHGPAGQASAESMTYRLKAAHPVLWIAWGPMFTAATANAMIERLSKGTSGVEPFVLATTREGREVQALRIGAGEGKPVVWLQARQHAWESGGSWVWSGIVEWLLSPDPLARQLRSQAEIVAVPIMDVDHVTTGDGGKDALPQDHNRDWQESPHWPEVAAAQRLLLGYAKQKRLRVFCDLHNPGSGDKKAYFYVSPKTLLPESSAALQDRFISLARDEFTEGPLLLELAPRESGPGYHPLWRQISKNWVHAHCGTGVIAVTLETPWNTPESTVEGYQKTGANLGRSIARFLPSAQ